MKYDIVGQTFKNKKGLEFIVLEKTGKSRTSISLYKIRFLESGYIADGISSGHIRKGEVKDHLSPSVFGVGCLGYAWGYAKRHESRRLYYTWRSMLRRCYDPSYNKYAYYGGIGIKVCARWHRLDYFVEDIVHLPGYDAEAFERGDLNLDKDIINRSAMIYSPETCCLVTPHENLMDALNRRWHPEPLPQ